MNRRATPIEDYLDELLTRLHLPPRETRRLLTEAEDHLREAAERAQQAGMPAVDAERAAVREFGPPSHVAGAAMAARRSTPRQLAASALWSLTTLGAVGLCAVGVSGAVAALFNVVAGPRFVGALPQTYPAGLCRYYLSIQPGAGSCTQAALLENSQDAVSLRLAAGLLGLLVVAACVWARRYLPRDVSDGRVRDGVTAAIAALTFFVAGAGLVGWGADIGIQHGSGGVGWYVSGGATALAAGCVAAALCWRTMRTVRPWAHFATSD